MVELANTAAWLDLLYGKCSADDGALVVVAAERNRIACAHSLGSGKDLVSAAKDMHRFPGCYLKINPMDFEAIEKRRRKERKSVIGGLAEVKTIVSIHLDVDAGKGGKYLNRAHARWAIDQMPLPPTLVINSNGDSGGFHAYWVLSEPYRIEGDSQRQTVQAIANRWQERLRTLCAGKLDSTANLDRVLRVVGVPRADGGMVSMESYSPECVYGLEEFNGV